MSFFKFFMPGLKENWKVVVLSITGAATFWFFNAMNKNYDTDLYYPLTYVFDRDSVVIIKPLAEKIKIEVSSGGWNLIRKTLRINADPIQIDLENPTDIKYLTKSSLIPKIKKQLSGLDVTYVVTDTLFFDIEEKVSRKFPVIVDSLAIPLRSNYRIVTPIKLDDDSVLFTGPKSMITKLGSNVEIAFKNDEIDSEFDEGLGYRINKLIKAEPKKTNVQFDVSKFLLMEIDIPIEFLNFPDDSTIVANQDQIKIYYTIDENYEDDINKNDFSITLDYTMLNARDSTIAPLLMYAHDKALDIVLNVDKVAIDKIK